MPKRLTIEEVRKKFSDQGKELLSTEYKNAKSPLAYKCQCNDILETTINSITAGYDSCNKCANEKRKKTSLEKFGVEFRSKLPDFKETIKNTIAEKYTEGELLQIEEKRLNTNLERYGTQHPSSLPEIKEKIKATNLQKYGYEFSTQNPDVIEKMKATNLQKYGYEYSILNREVQEKSKQTFIRKYGVDSGFKSPEIKEKRKVTLLRKYGVDSPLKSPELKAKMKATLMKNHGVDSSFKSPEIRAKAQKSMLEKYDTIYPMQNKEILKKRELNNLAKYGVEHTVLLKSVQEKSKQTVMDKYGVDSVSKLPQTREKMHQTNLLKYGYRHAMQNREIYMKQQASAFTYKIFKFPSGEEIKYQGYENYALQELLSMDIPEEAILEGYNTNLTIKYDFEEKERTYFPDIYIPAINLIIEVKSEYTYKVDYDKNMAKMKTSAEQGYIVELWVYNEKAERVETLQF